MPPTATAVKNPAICRLAKSRLVSIRAVV